MLIFVFLLGGVKMTTKALKPFPFSLNEIKFYINNKNKNI